MDQMRQAVVISSIKIRVFSLSLSFFPPPFIGVLGAALFLKKRGDSGNGAQVGKEEYSTVFPPPSLSLPANFQSH